MFVDDPTPVTAVSHTLKLKKKRESRFLPLPLCGACPFVGYCAFLFSINYFRKKKTLCENCALSLSCVTPHTLTLRGFFAIVLSSLFRNHRVEFEYLSTQQRFLGIWHNIYLLVSCARQRARERHRGERRARDVSCGEHARARVAACGERVHNI